MIEAKGLTKQFVRTQKKGKKEEFFAVDHVSFTAHKGEILGILGPNGAGKTTLLRMLGSLMEPTEGNVVITGQNIVRAADFTPKSQTFEDSVVAYRIGGGLQFWLSRHMAFRVTGRWTSFGGDFADYITEVNLGVRYHF